MSATTLDTSGLDRMTQRIKRMGDPDATLLMNAWMLIMDRDNKAGILAGLDHNGVPMAPVTYRPIGTPQKRLTQAQKNTLSKTARRGKYAGFGVSAAGLHNNLTTAEYRKLAGPPLAPRGAFSRVITNFMTDYAKLRPGYWYATYWWEDVVSTKGVPFLRYHFDGIGQKQRDLRGLRPEGREKARLAMRNWMIDAIRSAPDTAAPAQTAIR